MRPLHLVPFLLALTLVAAAPAGAQTATFQLEWGSTGSGAGQFWIPWDVAVDATGAVYVSDFSSTSGRPHRIQKFTGTGAFVAQWGSQGSADGQFDEPRGLAIDDAGILYVCDTRNRRIQKFTTAGAFVAAFDVPGGPFGGSEPYDVAVEPGFDVYVCDRVNDAILRFDPQGALVTRWGGPGSGDGQFSEPWSVAADRAGHVFVADRNNHRVQKFDASGTFLAAWGTQGSGAGQFTWPRGVSVDADGFVYVTDQIHRVQKFTGEGRYVSQFGTEGAANGQFEFPTGAAIRRVGGALEVYVVDTESHRVQKFGDTVVPVIATTWGRLKSLYH